MTVTEHQPRERAVPCQRCNRHQTFNVDAICDECVRRGEPCAYCGLLLVDDACPDAGCEANRPVPARRRGFGGRR